MNVGCARQQRSAGRTVYLPSDLEEQPRNGARSDVIGVRRRRRVEAPPHSAAVKRVLPGRAREAWLIGIRAQEMRRGLLRERRQVQGRLRSEQFPGNPGGRRHADVVLRSVGTRLQVGNIAARHGQGRRHFGHFNVAVLRGTPPWFVAQAQARTRHLRMRNDESLVISPYIGTVYMGYRGWRAKADIGGSGFFWGPVSLTSNQGRGSLNHAATVHTVPPARRSVRAARSQRPRRSAQSTSRRRSRGGRDSTDRR